MRHELLLRFGYSKKGEICNVLRLKELRVLIATGNNINQLGWRREEPTEFYNGSTVGCESNQPCMNPIVEPDDAIMHAT